MFIDFALNAYNVNAHHYLLAVTGLNERDREFNTRKEAEIAMHEICAKYDISVECSEQDKHERKYTNHEGVRFYINRI